MTKVINLLGGSGIGKSTTALNLAGRLKSKGIHADYVSEYVKPWARAGRIPGPFDQFLIAGKQSAAESHAYHDLDYIVTDSPIVLSAFYEEHHLKRQIVLPAVKNFLDLAKEKGIEHHYFFLTRYKPFEERGRYETEEQAKAIDVSLREWCIRENIDFVDLSVPEAERVGWLLSYFNLKE